jgi:peroxiredoxin
MRSKIDRQLGRAYIINYHSGQSQGSIVMVLTKTPAGELGWRAADFSLTGTDGKTHDLTGARGPNGLVVMFICNHCPYVKAVIDDAVADCRKLQDDGIGAIAIMPNDTQAYPEDSFANMTKFAAQHRFSFPYVIDESQDLARAYGAVCTPDFFGFDRDLALRYRGRLYETAGKTPKPGVPHELAAAMRAIAATGKGPARQWPSLGCSIKWRD